MWFSVVVQVAAYSRFAQNPNYIDCGAPSIKFPPSMSAFAVAIGGKADIGYCTAYVCL